MPRKPATSAGASAGDAPGACLITDQITGVQTSVLLTQAECSARGGQFIGGPVGPAFAAAIAKPKKVSVKTPKKNPARKNRVPKNRARKK
jgi:hypothetical protein